MKNLSGLEGVFASIEMRSCHLHKQYLGFHDLSITFKYHYYLSSVLNQEKILINVIKENTGELSNKVILSYPAVTIPDQG